MLHSLQNYAGAFNNTFYTKETPSSNLTERITMLLTGEFKSDTKAKAPENPANETAMSRTAASKLADKTNRKVVRNFPHVEARF